MQRPLLIAVVIGLAAGAVAALIILAGGGPSANAPQTTGTALIGGPFSLVDQTGKRVTEKDFAGHPMLVYFGFTNCPDVCPSGLQVISAALDKLGPKAAEITPLFVTLDPERDTVEVMRDYVKSFHPRLVGLTGSADEIAAVAKHYRVYFKKAPDESAPGRYTIDHSTFMYLMDGEGRFVAHFPHTVAVDALATGLEKAF